MFRHAVRIAAALLAAVATAAAAQSYPSRTITLIVPFAAGGPTDTLGRILAERMSRSLNQTIVVENVAGAGGTIANNRVKQATPDGYTIAIGHLGTHVLAPAVQQLNVDYVNDFEPVAIIAGSPMVLVTRPDLNARSVAEFISIVKSSPGKMSYGSSGNGSITHLALERLKQMAGIDLLHVPYKGTVPAVASVLSGDTVLAFGTIPGVVPHAKAGKLVMLGASFGKRFSQIPEVPAIAETLPGFDMGFYTALLAPAKTPKEIIHRLAAEVARAHAQPKTREIFAASAAEPGSMSPAQLRDYLASEAKSWGEVVKTVGLKID